MTLIPIATFSRSRQDHNRYLPMRKLVIGYNGSKEKATFFANCLHKQGRHFSNVEGILDKTRPGSEANTFFALVTDAGISKR